jgi:hypothetical protein
VKAAQTAAAIAARRKQTQDKLDQVEQAIGQLRRERGRLSVRSIAGRAGVSATFLYENSDARVLVEQATADSKAGRDRSAVGIHERIEASWRERALNAEAELGRTQQEILTQRQRIGELMGQLRDTEQMIPGDGVQATLTENTTLKRRVQQLAQENPLSGPRRGAPESGTSVLAESVPSPTPPQKRSTRP